MSLADLGLIGNCQLSALVRNDGAIVWSCMPRFDSPPLFGRLLDEQRGGSFLIGPADGSAGAQRYLPNTNVLETTFYAPDGAFRVVDFAPRFIRKTFLDLEQGAGNPFVHGGEEAPRQLGHFLSPHTPLRSCFVDLAR